MNRSSANRSSVNPPAVSVIIPTFDRWPKVRDAVASALRQTVAPLEVLVVDDGSTDGSADRLEAFTWSDDERRRLRVLRAPNRGASAANRGVSAALNRGVSAARNRGVSAARNRGIAESVGEWLAFLDSDDLWQPQKLERQLRALERAETDYGICHCDEIWIRHGRRVNPRQRHAKRGGWIYRHCLPLCAISPSAVMIQRRVFNAYGVFDEGLPACEDYDLWLRLTLHEPVLYVDEPLVTKYGGHDDQLSRRIPALDRYRIQALSRRLDDAALQGEERRLTLETLLQKIDIYGAGARKRGRLDEADALDALRARHLARKETSHVPV